MTSRLHLLVRLALLIHVVCLALLSPLSAADGFVSPARDGEMLLLNGMWRFKYVPDAQPIVGFHRPDFNEAGWSEIRVPAHWEMEGFVEPRYATVDPGIGYYRRTVSVPAAWRGKRVMLRFEGVLYGLRAWVNGRKVGEWDSSFNPVTFDVSDALTWDGQPQRVAVEVSTRSMAWEFDTMDCWGLSGIFRDVTLTAVPEVHLRDYSWMTTVAADGSARATLHVETSAASRVRVQLAAPDGSSKHSFEVKTDSNGAGTVEWTIPRPLLWTAETPVLYTLNLTVGEGSTAHSTQARVGIRQVSVDGGVLRLNGRPIKLRGINHHDIYPQGGRVTTEAEMRRDLELMRAANINFIRTSHYPPHPRFIELCDEMGFYVMCEVPFTFGERHLADPAFAPALERRARATVLRDRNRPSVLIWSVGNEHPITSLGTNAARYVKSLDPSRPLCFPTVGPEFERDIEQYLALPSFVEIFAPHYPTHRQLELYAARLDRPIIFTEFAHAMGLAMDRLEEQWKKMDDNPKIAGGAIWLFQDQGILRRADRPVDVTRPTPHVWRDSTHYYDTAGSSGADGIVYSDRTPQVDYWQVRRVYAPVGFNVGFKAGKAGQLRASIEISNRYDFRSLAGFHLSWTLAVNGTEIRSGTLPLSVEARGEERLELELPAETPSTIGVLALRCIGPSGEAVAERSFRAGVGGPAELAPAVIAELAVGQVHVQESPERLSILHPRLILEVDKRTGDTEIRDGDRVLLAWNLVPHLGRKLTMAEEERTSKTAVWRGAGIEAEFPPEVDFQRLAGGVRVQIRSRYVVPPVPGARLHGFANITVSNRGCLEVEYDFHVEGGSGQVLEAGMSLSCPRAGQALRWIGDGPFAGYPGKNALNDFGIFALSAEDLNFQGNRRAVELALLSGASGKGLALFCSPSDVAVEHVGDSLVLRHNRVVSGRGNTDIGPESVTDGAHLDRLAGRFTLLPLEREWPLSLRTWLGAVQKTPEAFRPYLHSYDQ